MNYKQSVNYRQYKKQKHTAQLDTGPQANLKIIVIKEDKVHSEGLKSKEYENMFC